MNGTRVFQDSAQEGLRRFHEVTVPTEIMSAGQFKWTT